MRNLITYSIAVLVGLLGYFVLRSFFSTGPMLIISIALIAIVAVVVIRNLRTNRKVAQATASERTEALQFAPASGKAVLYVFRNQFVGRAVGINVMIDGREVAQIKSPRFTRLLLTPGSHRIAGYTGTNKKPADGEGLELTANAGEVYVVKTEVEAQIVGVSVKFTPLALNAARADVQKITKMVVPDVAEV